MSERTLVAMAGFVVLGLSPSFVDWQQSPDEHAKIIAYYAAALVLIYVGLFTG